MLHSFPTRRSSDLFRAARLDNRGRPDLGSPLKAVREREERVAGQHAALGVNRVAPAVGIGDLSGKSGRVDAAHLAGPDAHRGAALGVDDGVRLDVLGDGEGEPEVRRLALAGRPLGDHPGLAGVERDDRFTLCEPVYGPGRNVPGLPEIAYDRTMTEAARRLVAEIEPDFLYQRMSFLNATGARVAVEAGLPYVCEYNGSIPWMARHWDRRPVLFERLALLYEDAALRTADLVIAVSAASRDELIARGVAPWRVLVNPNGVDLAQYRPDVDGRAVAARLGLADKTVIGFIGSFGRWHGAELLAEAFARLLARRADLRARVRLLMIGDGPTRAEAEARLAAAGIAGAAVFTGRIPQADGPAHLAAAQVLVAPHVPNRDGSRFFGSPTKLFEYMAMGRAIAASNLDQMGEVLDHERTALLVPPGDADALAAALERLADDPALCERLGAAARSEAEARYGWDRHAARILDALAERLAPDGGGEDGS